MSRRIQLLAGQLALSKDTHSLPLLSAENVLATRKSINILDSFISYLDTGKRGDKVVIFLHGNPTQAFLWRNIIPYVEPIARCLAPDLIGMGKSGKINSQYRFHDHFKYFNAWLDAMDLPNKLNFVIHDWGSGLGFHWCNLHRDRVQSIVYMEALIGPFESWENFPIQFKKMFQDLRSPKGEEMILKKNLFVEQYLPSAILRDMNKDEMDEYAAPYHEPGESRRPTLTWPREIPFLTEGPEDVVELVLDYLGWLSESRDIPKLYIHAEPGLFSHLLDKVVNHFPNNKKVTVKGHHFLQEDSPEAIGKAVRDFVKDL